MRLDHNRLALSMWFENFRSAFWARNAAWYRLLGLCPMLAVSTSVENAAALACASASVLISSSVVIGVLKPLIVREVRLPIFVLVVATFTTAASMFVEAFAWRIYMEVALYLQIVVTNCMILDHLERVAAERRIATSLAKAMGTATGFAAALLVLGAFRQLLAPVFPLAIHPSGAFIIFALLVAAMRWFSRESREADPHVREVAGSEPRTHH